MDYREIPFSPPDIREEEINEVVDTLRTGWITTGPKTKRFEEDLKEFIGSEKVVCLNSATAGLELILRILGVGPGDEVITSAYTYTASAAVIQHVGAKVVLVDVEKNSYEMNLRKLSEKITDKTKAIIAVDLGGRMCDYDEIKSLVESKKELFHSTNEVQQSIGRIAVISDAAHSLGASYKNVKSGMAADFTSFSFHAVKNLTTAEGGCVTWNCNIDSEWLYKQFMLYSLHGQSKDALSKTKKGAWEYDIVFPGYKFNMTDINASIGIHQLKRYPEILKRRKEIIRKYNDYFKELEVSQLNHFEDDKESSGHLYLLRINDINEELRNQLIIDLAEEGIATNVHYKPLPMLTAYKEMGYMIEDYPEAYDMYKNTISLPLHTKLSDEDIEYVAYHLLKLIKGLKR